MFLNRLLARTLGESVTLTPRRASRFEGRNGFEERAEEAVAPTPPTSGTVVPTVDTAPRMPASRPQAEQPTPPAQPSPARHSPETATAKREIHEVHTVEQRLVPPLIPTSAEPASRTREAPRPAEARQPASSHTHTTDPLPQAARPTPPPHVRAGHQSIERRFETLVREHTIERTVEIAAAQQPPAEHAAAAREPQPARPAVPQRIVPQAAPAPPSRRAARAERAVPPAPPPPDPVVHVTIGRVEVRAVQAPPAKPASHPREPRMGLEDYLARRERR